MPGMWLSLHSRSIISHLKLTHLEAICKLFISLREELGRVRETPLLFHHQRTLRGVPHPPNRTGPHAQHSFQVPCSINPDVNGNEGGKDTGTGLTRQVTRGRSEPRVGALGGEAPPSGVGRPGSSGRAAAQLPPFPREPGGANLHLILHDSPGPSILHPVTPFLGLTGEEEGNIPFLTMVLTLPF